MRRQLPIKASREVEPMKEHYEEPVMELILFENCDVITDSIGTDDIDTNGGG